MRYLILSLFLIGGFLTSCESEGKQAADRAELLEQYKTRSAKMLHWASKDSFEVVTRMKLPDGSLVAGEVQSLVDVKGMGGNIYQPVYLLRANYGENHPITFTIHTKQGWITAQSPPDTTIAREVLGSTSDHDRLSMQIVDGGAVYELHILGLPGWEDKDVEFWGFTGWPGEPAVEVAEEPVVPPHPKSLQGLEASIAESGEPVTVYRHFPSGETKELKIAEITGHEELRFGGFYYPDIFGPKIPNTSSSYWFAMGNPQIPNSEAPVGFWLKGTDWEIRKMVSATFTPDQPFTIELDDGSVINTSPMR